jgi:uncharacterized protein (TIGR00725 family)
MPLRVGVMGSATGPVTRDLMDQAYELGRNVALNGCVLITGACPGLPLAAACGAKQEGGLVVGISPALDLEEHLRKYHCPLDFHDVLIFTGSGLMGRELVNIRSSDIVVFVGGRSGTLGQLAIAYDEGRLIGVLTGFGGISDAAETILAACDKETGAHVVYETSALRLLGELLRVYRTRLTHRPSYSCADHPPGEADPMPGMERDPVCGMLILPQAAEEERSFEGDQYVFCSPECVERFDADQLKYVPKARQVADPATRAGETRSPGAPATARGLVHEPEWEI